MHDLKKTIDRTLDNILPSAVSEPKAIHRAMRYSVFPGGKRIRPIIAVESAKACGAGIKDALIVGSAIELIHAYSLIHDDLPAMDDDDWRRGKPSCHKKFGEATAILAGDALLPLALGIIAKKLPPKVSAKIISELSDAIGSLGMAGGQALDLEKASGKKHSSDEIDRLKTGKLFEASARLGGLAAGASAKEIAALTKYGAHLGQAFQVADDILDKERYKNLASKRKATKECERLVKKSSEALIIFGKKSKGLEEIAAGVLRQIKNG